jgi:hypothetical protein
MSRCHTWLRRHKHVERWQHSTVEFSYTYIRVHNTWSYVMCGRPYKHNICRIKTFFFHIHCVASCWKCKHKIHAYCTYASITLDSGTVHSSWNVKCFWASTYSTYIEHILSSNIQCYIVEDKFKFISRVKGSPWIHTNYIHTYLTIGWTEHEGTICDETKKDISASQQNLPDRPCTQDRFQCKCSVHSLALLCSNSFVRAGERGTEPQISSNFQRKCYTLEKVMLAAVRIDFNIRLPTQLPNLKQKNVWQQYRQ